MQGHQHRAPVSAVGTLPDNFGRDARGARAVSILKFACARVFVQIRRDISASFFMSLSSTMSGLTVCAPLCLSPFLSPCASLLHSQPSFFTVSPIPLRFSHPPSPCVLPSPSRPPLTPLSLAATLSPSLLRTMLPSNHIESH